MKLLPLFENEMNSPWGNSEQEIIKGISHDILKHVNPIQDYVHEIEVAFREGDLEKCLMLLGLAKDEMVGVGNVFQQMQDFLDNETTTTSE
jgi:hypothetical protein